MRKEGAKPERLVAKLAARQHGVVSTVQLHSAGLGDYAISRRVEAGRFHRIHRGVYAVGHTRLSFEGRCMAAALACGEGAAISHRSAAALWGILSLSARGSIELTLPTDGGRKRRRGIVIHRSRTLTARDVKRRAGIPLTSPLRTLADVRRTQPEKLHQRAIRRALDLRLVSEVDLGTDPDLTRSELERQFLTLCRRRRVPKPEVNVRVDRFEVDFLWREEMVVVETDGFRHHGHRAAFESDRTRDAELQSLGYQVLRFTYRQVCESTDDVASALRAVLGLCG